MSIMVLFETTASALDSAVGSVLSSEALSSYTEHAQLLPKQTRGRIQSWSRGFEKGLWRVKNNVHSLIISALCTATTLEMLWRCLYFSKIFEKN